ncbi:hypothetical protein N566_21370 [Streptomycetaceae bacterium MP113-05]|nr:hypothetical protein N566_21370 [Streptomycetaceae bacterium MP113-05]
MLAGNADRERTVDVLRAAYAEGRLTMEEYEQRVGRALASRTIEELQHLAADVPQGPGTAPAVRQHPVYPAPHQGYPVHRGYGAPYPPPMPYAPRPSNGAAIGSLVCGLLAPFTMGVTGVPAVILGHKARAEIRRTGERGDGWAVAGLALGWIGVCFVLMIFLAIAVD